MTPKMTLIKRPTLDRQRQWLGFEPHVGIAEGVRRVCAVQSRLVRSRRERSDPTERLGAAHMVPTVVRSNE